MSRGNETTYGHPCETLRRQVVLIRSLKPRPPMRSALVLNNLHAYALNDTVKFTRYLISDRDRFVAVYGYNLGECNDPGKCDTHI